MEKRCASILLMLSLEALLVVAGISEAAVSGNVDTIRLPSDVKTGKMKDEERPWECCDLAICTRSLPPICQCSDQVEQCSNACKECEEVEGSNPLRYICKDIYYGFPGPQCTEDQENHIEHGGLAEPDSVVAVERETTGGKKNDDEETRPWECCDMAFCAKSFPPICRCMDKVERCSNACKRCEEVEGSNPTLYMCKDVYRGFPGPQCLKDEENHGNVVHGV